jgi:hypothetical protein
MSKVRLRIFKHHALICGVFAAGVIIGTCAFVSAAAFAEEQPTLVNHKGEALKAKKFSIKSGSGVLESVNSDIITCTSDVGRNADLLTLNTGYVPSMVLTGCKKVATNCNTAGAAAGEVQTVELEFYLVYIIVPTEVGWRIVEKGPGPGVLAAIKCGGDTVLITKGTIGRITPLNKFVKAGSPFTVTFSEEKGVQKPTEYVNSKGEKVIEHLGMEGEGEEKFALKEAAFSSTEELIFEEEAEIHT